MINRCIINHKLKEDKMIEFLGFITSYILIKGLFSIIFLSIFPNNVQKTVIEHKPISKERNDAIEKWNNERLIKDRHIRLAKQAKKA